MRDCETLRKINILENIVEKLYNKIENIEGKVVKYILIAGAGSEGISLRNVRQIHIMEPFWNETRIMQLVGRAIRQCYHKDLPMEERIVDIFKYQTIKRNNESTVDEYVQEKIFNNKVNDTSIYGNYF